MLGASRPIINDYHRNFGNTHTSTYVSNNAQPLPISLIRQRSTKNVIEDTYSTANPHPRSNAAADTDALLHLSAFLQHPTWPLCPKADPCRKPTLVHRPDLCVVYEELANSVPVGRNQYKLPIFICEIEGSKDVWGDGEHESKAIEEVCYSLPFILENYILFVYHIRFEVWCCKRNPHTSTIDIQCETIHLQQDGDSFRDKLVFLTGTIIEIIVKQLMSGKALLDIALPCYRQMGCDGINIFHPPTNVCDRCWCLGNPTVASNLCFANPNNVPMFE